MWFKKTKMFSHTLGSPLSQDKRPKTLLSCSYYTAFHLNQCPKFKDAVTGVAPKGPVGPGLPFISRIMKNKPSKFAIKNAAGTLADTGWAPGAYKWSSVSLKQRQNAPVSFVAFKMFFASQNIVLNSNIMHRLDSYCFKKISAGRNIVSNSVKMQQSPSLISHLQGKVGLPHSDFD